MVFDISTENLLKVLKEFVSNNVLEEFIQARGEVIALLPLLNQDNDKVLELLISSKSVRKRVSAYIANWKTLLGDFLDSTNDDYKSDSGIYLSLLDGHWTRDVSEMSNVADVQIGMTDVYNHVELLRLILGVSSRYFCSHRKSLIIDRPTKTLSTRRDGQSIAQCLLIEFWTSRTLR